MPLYGFKCAICEHTEDKLISVDISDRPQVCPKCAGMMFKQFSAPVRFDFRGTGFYETDFKGK
jgi:putative FmdB family regulatory protein